MNRQLLSLALATIFINSIAFVPSVDAQDGQDPRDRKCEQNAETLTSTSGGKYRRRARLWEEREIRIELRKSEPCKANWVKADVPAGTVLYLKGQDGRTYVPYQTQTDGVSFGDMMNYSTPFSACAKLPDGREVCTSIVGN